MRNLIVEEIPVTDESGKVTSISRRFYRITRPNPEGKVEVFDELPNLYTPDGESVNLLPNGEYVAVHTKRRYTGS